MNSKYLRFARLDWHIVRGRLSSRIADFRSAVVNRSDQFGFKVGRYIKEDKEVERIDRFFTCIRDLKLKISCPILVLYIFPSLLLVLCDFHIERDVPRNQ